MSEFNPANLTRGGSETRVNKPKVKSERIFMKVTGYETPAEGFHFAVGERLDRPGQQVRVRLTTVAERVTDTPNKTLEQIEGLYVSGATSRPTLADKAKSKDLYISFDDARFIGQTGDDKVPTFRAHWCNTMAAPEAELHIGYGAIKLDNENAATKKKAVAQVDFIKSATQITAENAGQVLSDAFAITDENGNARKPFVVIRAIYEGKSYANPRIYPAQVEASVFDQNLGRDKTIVKTADAEKTLDNLMSGKPFANELSNKSADLARAMVAGIFGMEMPTVNTPELADKCKELYAGAKEGALSIEVLAGETMYFGKSSGISYVQKKDRPQFAKYKVTVNTPSGDSVQDGFTKTIVAFQRHPDGEPYVVFASPLAMNPFPRVMSELKLETISPTKSLDAAVEAANVEADAPVQDAPAVDDSAPVAEAPAVSQVDVVEPVTQEAESVDPDYDNMP